MPCDACSISPVLNSLFHWSSQVPTPMILDNGEMNMLETSIYFKWQPPLATSVASYFHCWVFAMLLSDQSVGCLAIAMLTLQFLWGLSSSRVQWCTGLYGLLLLKTDPSCPGYSPFPKVSNGKLGAHISQGLFPAAVQHL